MPTASLSWKTAIVNALLERDFSQKHVFADIFIEYATIKDRVVQLTEENNTLEYEVTRNRQDKTELLAKLEKTNALKCHDYEQKLFQLQEELTELYRQKGALAQDVIELNKALHEKERILQSKSARLSELEEFVKELQTAQRQSLDKIKELEHVRKLLNDEQVASSLALKNMEKRNRQIEEDNARLIQHVSALQLTVERLKNIEYDVQYEKKQESIRQNLLDAACTAVNMCDMNLNEPAIKYAALLPKKALTKIDANEGDVNTVRFSPSGSLFGSGGFDRKLRLWAVVNGKCELRSTLVGCNAAITAIDFDPEETVVLGASSDFACRVWTLNDGRLRVNLTGHSERVVAAKFMGCPNRVVTASSDRTLKIWDVDKCRCKRTIMAGSAIFDVVTCSPLNAIITGHYDHNLRIWDERTGETTGQITLSGLITGLDLSPDGAHVLACTRNDTLEITNLRSQCVVQHFQAEGFRVGLDIVRPCFSPDCQYVAAGSQDGGIYIWNTITGNLETCLCEHTSTVVCCHWNPRGHSIVSCERVKKAIVWADY